MSSLKQKTVSGLIWSAIESFATQGITFIVGIVLARVLTPKEFGLIAMVTIFIALSETFINSGFAQALIRKTDCTEKDYSTVFFFNLLAGTFFFIVLLLTAPLISDFFKEPILKPMVRVLALGLIISSLTIIQRTTLIKRIDFKLQTKISIIASVVSGIIGVVLAIEGFGVWSLVYKTISQQAINSCLLWIWNKWRPQWTFSKASFKELFGFGSKLLASSIIDTAYRNIYYLIIGKYFSTTELGFFKKAQEFQDFPTQSLNTIMSRVTYPVLAEIQQDTVKLKLGYKKMIKSTMLISMLLMVGIAAVARPLIIVLIKEQWEPSIIFLQLFTFIGMLYPLQSLNLNMLQVQGRSDLFLKLEIIKKAIAIPILIVGIAFGIKVMILGMWLSSLIAYYLNSYWSGKLIRYSIKEQVADILPGFFVALIMGISVWSIGWILPVSELLKLIIQIISGIAISFLLCETFKLSAYLEIKEIVISKFFKRKKVE